MTSPIVLIPAKSLNEGKSRLSSVLSCAERRELNKEFIRRSIAIAAEFAGCDRSAVVSHCPEVLELAQVLGMRVIRHSGVGGLNAAVGWGVKQLRAQDARDILVMASDMPWLRVSDLREVHRIAASTGSVVLGADRHGSGTNLVFLTAGLEWRFSYGVGSLERHLAEARRVGGGSAVYRSAGTGFDVDTPEDLHRWQREEVRSSSRSSSAEWSRSPVF